MIQFFRAILTSKIGAAIALTLLVILGFAFVLGDVTGMSGAGQVGDNVIAKVGSRSITMQDVRQRVQIEYRRAQQQNPQLTMEQFLAGDTLDALINQTVELYALEQYARTNGIGIDRETIDAEIARTPGFAGVSGSFDQEIMRQALQQQGMSVDQYRANLINASIVRQLVAAYGTLRDAPRGLVVPYASLLMERRIGDATFVPASRFAPTADPTPQQLQAFYTAQRQRYLLPERRVVRYAVIDQSNVPAVAPPTSAQIAEAYRAASAEFAARETRRFNQVIVETRAAADRIAAAARGGQSLDAAARAAGLSAARIDAANKESFAASTSAAVADTAFAAPQGGIVGPLQVPLGFVVLHVESATSIPQRTLAEVTPMLTQRLNEQHKQEAMVDLFNNVQDALNGGASVAEIATDKHLALVETPAILANGQSLANPAFRWEARLNSLLSAAFQMHQGDAAQLVTLEEGRVFAAVDVPTTIAAAPPPLAEIATRATADWKQAEGAKRARDVARRILANVENGQSMSAASTAAGNSLSVQQITARRLDTVIAPNRVPPEVALLFAMDGGAVRTLEMPGGSGWMVIKLARIEPGDASGDQQVVTGVGREFVQALGADYVQILVNAARAQFPVNINREAVRTLREQLLGRGGN